MAYGYLYDLGEWGKYTSKAKLQRQVEGHSLDKEIKTDKRDARKIAKCLAYDTYSPVYVPTDQDNAIKEFIRIRDDAQTMLKQTKQQINAFCSGQAFL